MEGARGWPGSVRSVVSPPDSPVENGAQPRAWRTAATPLKVLVGLLGFEALALVGIGVAYLVALPIAHRQTQVWVTLAESGLALLFGASLAFMARGVVQGRRWPRSPAITLQLVGLPLSGRVAEFGGWWLAVPMIAVLVVTLLLLFGTAPRMGAGSGGESGEDPGSERPGEPDPG
jgi:hypothetical protein